MIQSMQYQQQHGHRGGQQYHNNQQQKDKQQSTAPKYRAKENKDKKYDEVQLAQ